MEGAIKMTETEQGDGVNNEGESSVDISNNSPTKRGRGRPQGSKKLKVCVTDINLMELVSGISNGGSTQPQRGRGRPKLSDTKHTEEEGSGDDHADNTVQTHRGKGRPKGSKKQETNGDNPLTDHSPRKRGRPKKSLTPDKAAAEDLPNGGSDTPKSGRGRPKGSPKCKSESLTSGEEDEGGSVTPRKRGRPKGSPNKKPRLEREVSSEGEADTDGSLNSPKRGQTSLRSVEGNDTERLTQDTSNGLSETPRRGRGRPRKILELKRENQDELVTDGSQPAKRGRGRPKGSLNKKPPAYSQLGRLRRVLIPPTIGRHGRPRQQPGKRGRPRKYPLPSPEELKKPKVWKPLGRPRKYPRVDPPEGALPAPRRSRGRPRKSESKKGAHLRKSLPIAPSSQRNPNDGSPRKRGRPPGTAKIEDVTPRKRGRPKGSLNKNKVGSGTQLDSALPNHSKEKSDSPAAGVEYEGEAALEEAEEAEEVEHDTEMMPTEYGNDTDETLAEQDASFEDSDQA